MRAPTVMYDLKTAPIFVFVNSILFSFSVLDFLPLFSILRAFPFCEQRSHLPAAVFSFSYGGYLGFIPNQRSCTTPFT